MQVRTHNTIVFVIGGRASAILYSIYDFVGLLEAREMQVSPRNHAVLK